MVHVKQRICFGDYAREIITEQGFEKGESGGGGGLVDNFMKRNIMQITLGIAVITEEERQHELEHVDNGAICEVHTSEFVWHLTDSDFDDVDANDRVLDSKSFEAFGLSWIARVSTHGVVCLSLAKELDEDTVVSLRCFMCLPELGVRYVMRGVFAGMHDVRNWGRDRVSRDMFRASLKTGCTLKIEMQLVDVYRAGKNVTHDFVDVD